MEWIWLVIASFALGTILGMSLQWRRDQAYIRELEEWKITLWHTIDTQAEYIDALEGDDDEDEDGQDDGWDDDQYETDKALLSAGSHE